MTRGIANFVLHAAALLGVCAAHIAPVRADSSFRLISATVKGSDAVIEVGVHTTYKVPHVELFAHAEPARHNSLSSGTKGLITDQGLPIGKLPGKQGTAGHKVRVPLAKLAKHGFGAGDPVYLAARWPTSWNSGVGHQWGALQGLAKNMKDYSFVVGAPEGPAKGAKAQKTASSRIDINRATAAELRRLPGIGKVRAARIVNARPKAGYRRYTDLKRLPGFNARIVKGLRGRATARQL